MNPKIAVLRFVTLVLLTLLFCVATFAQTADAVAVQKRIEADVWAPLFNGSNKFDAEMFLSTASPDLIRVSVDQKRAYGLETYRKEIIEGFGRARERNVKRVSEARFLARSTNDGHAYETGYFRSEVILPNGEKRIRYSQFEFVLRLEKGQWRILIDRDNSLDEGFSEQDYLKAAPMHLALSK